MDSNHSVGVHQFNFNGNLEPCHYNFVKFEICHRYLNDM
jgi:hypothetical protein